MTDKTTPAAEVWVTTAEAAELTGYNQLYLTGLVGRIWRLPEEKRRIKIRKRSNWYEMWLPDLMAYANKYGPQRKRKESLDKE
ncbi:MAG: hypothetical protein SGI73_00570 [Chloroflexota bacterium]|nr:hypothetical protein [Chloroflexota bacterium]